MSICKRKVIYDCDNTMGMKNRDVDDGLALMYLLGTNDIELLCLTLTYGNDTVANVYKKTMELVKKLDLKLSVYKGNEKGESCENLAAKKIVEFVNKYPNEIELLVTGSTQNISDCINLDSDFSKKVKRIILMGGIEKKLNFNGKIMNELNFSINYKATYNVLNNFENISILTGNNCMRTKFFNYTLENLKKIAKKNSFVIKKLESWMEDFKEKYNENYIILWDVIAAAYLAESENFIVEEKNIDLENSNLKEGILMEGKGKLIKFPYVKSNEKINEDIVKKVFL